MVIGLVGLHVYPGAYNYARHKMFHRILYYFLCRFCCTNRPNVTVQSKSNEMMIVFKSNYTVNNYSLQRGFKAIVIARRNFNYLNNLNISLIPPRIRPNIELLKPSSG